MKETWNKHPITGLFGSAFILLSIGFGIGNYFHDAYAKLHGRIVLTESEHAALIQPVNLSENQIIIDKTKLETLESRPKFCTKVQCEETQTEIQLDCISENTPFEITSKFYDYTTELYNKEELNKKMLRDKYLTRWVCGQGWPIKVYGEPEIDSEGYWTFDGIWKSPEDKSDLEVIRVRMKNNYEAKNLSIDSEIWVKGRISGASSNSISLSEVIYELR